MGEECRVIRTDALRHTCTVFDGEPEDIRPFGSLRVNEMWILLQ
jgi:hypothetical protein